MGSVDKNYHGAGIQTFQHLKHEDYACQGPYIKDWMKGAASWHPSVIAHRLRASHHAYFWLLVWHEAVREVAGLAAHRAVDAILKDVEHHLGTLYPPMHAAAHKSAIVDDMKCFTDYEPRSVREVSLKDRVVAGLAKDDAAADAAGWRFSIYENLVDKKLVENSLRQGYQDFKKLMYGNVASGPLSLSLSITKDGPVSVDGLFCPFGVTAYNSRVQVLVCETPGIWGKLPDGFVHFYESKAEIYVTLAVADKAKFVFNQGYYHSLKGFSLTQSPPSSSCGSSSVCRYGQAAGYIPQQGAGHLLDAAAGRQGERHRGGGARAHPRTQGHGEDHPRLAAVSIKAESNRRRSICDITSSVLDSLQIFTCCVGGVASPRR